LVYTVKELRRFHPQHRGRSRRHSRNKYDYRFDNNSRNRLFLFGGGGVASKWQGRGFGGRFWRHGIPDGFRAARIGYGAFESDNHRGSHFHGDFAFAGNPGDAKRIWIRQRFGAAEGTSEDGSSDAGEQASERVDSTVDTAAADRAAASAEEVVCNNAEVAELADALA
jgi:hypothetical protein